MIRSVLFPQKELIENIFTILTRSERIVSNVSIGGLKM